MTPDPDWWRAAVFYQGYIRSFADGNGDGVGEAADVDLVEDGRAPPREGPVPGARHGVRSLASSGKRFCMLSAAISR